MTNLEVLSLGKNQLTGNIPAEFANLTNLTGLYIWGNSMSGCFNPALSTLCGQLSDVGISYGNNFTISWADFCNDASCDNKIAQNQEIDIFNYPNPFTDYTTIEYTLPQDSPVTLAVYDMIGKQIAVLHDNETKTKGTHTTVFESGNYPAGVYYYSIRAGEYVSTQKMVLAN